MNLDSIDEFCKEINTLYCKIPKNEKTFLEISGYPNYEVVCSNILAFYLNPNEEHGLKDIVLMSLIETVQENSSINLEKINISNLEVFREYYTLKGNRIDLVLKNQEIVIGIENKINAFVNNDLTDYANTLNKLNNKAIKILLTVNDERKAIENSDFINITYRELFKRLKNKLLNYKIKNNKWYIYLIDFINNIEGYEVDSKMNNEIRNWFLNHQKDVDEFMTILNKVKEDIRGKSEEYARLLEEKLQNNNKVKFWKSDKAELTSFLELDFGCNLDAYLNVNGWKIGLFICRKNKTEEIKKALIENGVNIISENDNHKWIAKYDYDSSIEEIVEKTIEIYKILETIK